MGIKTKQIRIYFYIVCILAAIFTLASCAKKMLPPSPDRFAPRLQEIIPVNQIRLDLSFDEEIDANTLRPDSFYITSPEEETITIRTVSRGTNANTITLYTMPLSQTQYQISGTVADRLNNRVQFRRKFRASVKIDSIPPRINRILPQSGTTRKNRNIAFEFSFSEPIDTTRPVSFLVYPLDKKRINWQYSSDWQSLTFGYSTRSKSGEILSDSLAPNTNVYFILQPSLADLSGNRVPNCAYTFFTTESVLPLLIVSGNLYYQNQPHADGIVIFSNPALKAVTISDQQGNFAIRLDSLSYQITALKDTNFDNFVDLIAGLTDFNPLDTIPLKLNLQPVQESQEIDYYLR